MVHDISLYIYFLLQICDFNYYCTGYEYLFDIH